MASDETKKTSKRRVVEMVKASRNWKGAYQADYECPSCKAPLSSVGDTLLESDDCPNCKATFAFAPDVQTAYWSHKQDVELKAEEGQEKKRGEGRSQELKNEQTKKRATTYAHVMHTGASTGHYCIGRTEFPLLLQWNRPGATPRAFFRMLLVHRAALSRLLPLASSKHTPKMLFPLVSLQLRWGIHQVHLLKTAQWTTVSSTRGSSLTQCWMLVPLLIRYSRLCPLAITSKLSLPLPRSLPQCPRRLCSP